MDELYKWVSVPLSAEQYEMVLVIMEQMQSMYEQQPVSFIPDAIPHNSVGKNWWVSAYHEGWDLAWKTDSNHVAYGFAELLKQRKTSKANGLIRKIHNQIAKG